MNNKELVILAGKKQGGGSVTPASIVTATGQMTAQQKAETRANIGATDASTSIPDNVKQALLACFADVAWADDQGQAHYDALEAALYPLDHITAVYTQSGTVYDTDSLDSLKADLVVTAVYEGGNTATVAAANYTLSGTLTEGTSTITVSYGGKTTTFDVTVTANVFAVPANWSLNMGLYTTRYGESFSSIQAPVDKRLLFTNPLELEANKSYTISCSSGYTLCVLFIDGNGLYQNRNPRPQTQSDPQFVQSVTFTTEDYNWISVYVATPATATNADVTAANVTLRME